MVIIQGSARSPPAEAASSWLIRYCLPKRSRKLMHVEIMGPPSQFWMVPGDWFEIGAQLRQAVRRSRAPDGPALASLPSLPRLGGSGLVKLTRNCGSWPRSDQLWYNLPKMRLILRQLKMMI